MAGLRRIARRRLHGSLRRRQLWIEPLEDRRLLSLFTVNWAGDEPDRIPGDGKAETANHKTTMRAAIMEANASPGKDTIEFNVTGAGPHVIKPATPLPAITDAISINGYSQPGASPTSLTLAEGNNAVIKIELDGSLCPIGTNGLEIFGGQSEVTGLAIHSFYGRPTTHQEFLGTTIVGENGSGIWLWSGGNNQIVGNFLGATASGRVPTYPVPAGVATSGIMVGSYDNVIQENLVVGNHGPGIVLGSKLGDTLATNVYGNKVHGNYVGMERNGRTPLANDTGILVCWGAHDNEIGGGSANFGNLISGNSGVGVSIVGVGPGGQFFGGNVIQRNLIGTDRTGKVIDPDKKPNTGDETGNRHAGIQIDRSPDNTIGGTTADAANVISGNEAGILIVGLESHGNVLTSNKIGTDLTGATALPNWVNGVEIQGAPSNQITQNLISGNAASGVRLSGVNAKKNTIRGNKIGTNLAGTAALANRFSGIDISDAPQNTVISNTISGNLGSGVWISGQRAEQNIVSQNYIGTDATGLQALGNNLDGITITGASKTTVDGNTIADSTFTGISVQGATATLNRLYGNFVGTDVSGTKDLGNGLHGIWIQDSPANEIGHTEWGLRNVVSGNTGDGIRIAGKTAKGNQVFGNYLGTSIAGTQALSNSGAGVYVEGAPENIIGGETADRRNVISGNAGCGVVIFGADALKNKIQGNYIGTNSSGMAAGLKNAGDGVFIHRAAETLVGGNATKLGAAPGNLIAQNDQSGVHIKGFGARDNIVQGNVIGQDSSGAPLGNALHGVFIELAPTNVVGDTTAEIAPTASSGRSNVISANKGNGVRISGGTAVGNLVRRNELYDNVGLGINLADGQEQLRPNRDGVTPNDAKDVDSGANDVMNFPVGITAWYDGVATIISGVLDTTDPEKVVVDLYATTAVHATGFGEGRFYLGSVTPKESGVFRFVVSGRLGPATIPGFPASATVFLSGTATNANRSTSEFSPVYGDPDGDKLVDSDEDGLPDVWERDGVDFNGDGEYDLDLPSFGAKWDRKDVFVEFDWMPGCKLSDASIDAMKTAFRRAPVSNPGTGGTGITLHVNHPLLGDTGDEIPFSPTIPDSSTVVPFRDTAAANDDFWDLKKQYLGSPLDRVSPNRHNIVGARSLVEHYTISVHATHDNAGGWGEVRGNDFIYVYTGEESAFMHELGHNLGLGHGGPYSRDAATNAQADVNYKPNHLSIMNYAYTYTTLATRRPLDYSRYTTNDLVELDESSLLEFYGLTFGKPWLSSFEPWTVVYSYADGTAIKKATGTLYGPVDWNHDGQWQVGPVSANINYDAKEPPTHGLTVLRSQEEWTHLQYNFRGYSPFEGPGFLPNEDYFLELARTMDSDGDGINNADDNVSFVFNPDQTDSDGDGIGDVGELASLVLSDASVLDGAQVTATVTLLLPAPSQGALVELFSGEPWMVDLPQYVVIPAGERAASFTFPVTALNPEATRLHIYASYGEAVVRTELTIAPARTSTDLSVMVTAEPDPVGLGGVVTYTIDVTNEGPEPAAGVRLADVLPDGAVLRSTSGTISEEVRGPGLRVRFDYTYDTSNFFDTQEKRDLLQLAGDILMGVMGDDLAAIVPEGGNSWTAIFDHPATGTEEHLDDLVVPANEIIVFVGARDLGDTGTGVQEGALAGPGGLSASGADDFTQNVTTRGERGAGGSTPTDFGPWGGTITFNTNPAVAFSYDGDPDASEFDFFTVALHEMMHVLGLGTSASWETYVNDALGVFTGPASRLEYDGGGDVPLDPDTLAHWLEGITESNQPVLMDPLVPNGLRIWYPTALDWAGLADVGWNIDGLLTVERPVTFTEMAGSVIGDVGVLEPGQSVEITIEVQPTIAGTIHNVAAVSGYCDDSDLTNNTAETFGSVTPLVLIVNTTDDVDDGVVDATHTSLREAINAANSAPGVNTISFNIPGPGPHTIQPTSPLPVITDPVIIDGTTEPDFAGTPVIELSGVLSGSNGNGLTITVGGSTVRALVINRFQSDGSLETGSAILLQRSGGNVIEGCYLGTDVSGTMALGNDGAGVLVLESDDNTIGGTVAGAGNVISGNGYWGVFLGPEVTGNLIAGNLIGTDTTGTSAIGNGQAGVELHRATNNLVGGRTPEARNVISGNAVGVLIRSVGGLGGTTNRIEGNYIGTNAAGAGALGNTTGILINEFLSTFSGRDRIGDAAAGAGNVIAGNVGTGIQITSTGSIPLPGETYPIYGNLIGVAADGVTPLGNGGDGILLAAGGSSAVFGGGAEIGGPEPAAGNIIAYNGGHGVHLREVLFPRVRGNAIYANGGLGIEYVFTTPPPGSLTAPLPAGVNPQRPGIDHTLVDFPNAPVLSRVFSGSGSTTIEGTITSYHVPDNVIIVNPLHWTLDFYASSAADTSGHGEGQIYLGSLDDVYAMGTRDFSTVLPMEVPAGYVVAATATGSFYDNTSEFSNCVTVAADTDGDGVIDVVEDAGPNGGDANLDGTADRLQNQFASLPNSEDGQYLIVEVEAGGILRDVRALKNPSPYDVPPSVSFPLGFFSLAAGSGPVTFHLPSSNVIGTVYAFGTTAEKPFDHWWQVPASSIEIYSDSLKLTQYGGGIVTGLAKIEAGAGSTIVVNSVDDNDDGQPENDHMTLREAITLANFLPGRETITFNIPGTGPHTIQPRSVLPQITDALVIDGYTQPGACPATETTPATIMIELDGSLAGTQLNGLDIAADDSVLRGLCINRFKSGRYGWYGGTQVVLAGSRSVVEGNYIGVDLSGTVAFWEPGIYDYSQANGIQVGPDDNLVGGTTPASRNVVSGLTSAGIAAEWSSVGPGTPRTRIMGNFVGTDASGTASLGNMTGILLRSSGVVVGGVAAGAGNLISGNLNAGLLINGEFGGSEGHVVQGNLIGTDVTGTLPLGNGTAYEYEGGAGIMLVEADNNLIGGTVPEARNVISGNNGEGIWIRPVEGFSQGNIVQGNLIGTDISGTAALGNRGNGVRIEVARDGLVGGPDAGAGNVIAYNGLHGVVVIGQPWEYQVTLRNAILSNRIFSNVGLGIDLAGDGVSPNDAADGFFDADPQVLDVTVQPDGSFSLVTLTMQGRPHWQYSARVYFVGGWYPNWYEVSTDDTGLGQVEFFIDESSEIDHVELVDIGNYLMANKLQNYPEITSVTLSGDTTIDGILDSTPETSFRLEFFDNSLADDSGYGEGQSLLGALDVTTDATGIAVFSLTLPRLLPLDHFVTATATDPDGNTSEFSQAVTPTAETWDFGDAPDPSFPTLVDNNGARHALGSQLYLGLGVDAEEDGQPTEWADGDDTTDTADEDGVVFLRPLVPGQWVAVEVTASAQGRLDAWIDFAGVGTWTESEDHVFSGVTLLPGPNTLFFQVPASASVDALVCTRFRLSSAGGLNFDGPAVDGEVEDYLVTIVAPATDNQPPTARDDEATTSTGVPVAIDVTANDSDPEGQLAPHTVTVTALPAAGAVFVDSTSGVITYMPSGGFTGQDEFSYRVRDTRGLSDTARVTVQVMPGNQPPVAIDDEVTTTEEVPIVIDVLANDTDPDDDLDPTTVSIVVPPVHGLLEVDTQNGAVTYTPDPNHAGADRFVYAVSDTQGATAQAVVKIHIQPVNDAPVATDDLTQTDEATAVVIDVLSNDTDADGDLDPTSVVLLQPPLHGSAEPDPVTGAITYAPTAGFTGVDTLVYRVLDANQLSALATVRIEVRPTSSPPDAIDDTVATPEDTTVVIDVAANDTDEDGDLDPHSVQILAGPLRGSAEVDTRTGHILYTPPTDFAGQELLLYQIRDARGQSDIALVNITVTSVNDPPIAQDDSAIVPSDTFVDLYVLANDTDADSALDPASARIDRGPVSGVAVVQPDGSVRYTPQAGFTGTDTFRYSVADDTGARSNTALVTITVQAEPLTLIVGRAFEDLDELGPGLEGPGIALNVIYLLDGQGQLVASTTTQLDDPHTSEDETGWYQFPDLPSGTYLVAQKRVAGWSQSYPADQGIELSEPPVNPGLHMVTLSREHTLEVLDFGDYRSGEPGYASIAGHVYVDADNDGVCDPHEMGLPNVPVTIEGPVTRVVVTDATGAYRAEGLPAGVYTISETQPLLFQDGRDTVGSPASCTLANDRFENLELLPDMVAEDYNFGEYGLKAQFISKQLFLASTPPASQYVTQLQLDAGQSLVLMEAPAAGTLRATARGEGEPPAIQLYDLQWRPVSLTSRAGVLRTTAQAGQGYLIYVDAQQPSTVSAALDTAPPPQPVYVYTYAPRPVDVNADGHISPLDALLVITTLNTSGARALEGVNLSTYYPDVSGDHHVSPLDALLVLHTLNHADAEGEGEPIAAVHDRALLEYLAELESPPLASAEL